MSPVQIDVDSAQRRYAVHVGSGILARAAQYLTDAGLTDPVVVTVPAIWRRHGARIAGLAGDRGPVLMADGERAKTLLTVSRLYDAFAKYGLTRTSTVVAFGGGVVGDAAGFAAATYLRGVPFVQIPTTLLAQVDSSVGGKVGVNLVAGKNLAGAFHPPVAVLCDTDVLGTLPRREFRAGLYEVVKYGVIASRDLFNRVEGGLDHIFDHDADRLESIVADCCRIKAGIVSRDEREAGPRRVLNFGHTVGHALEAITGFRRFRHGEAIAHGMKAAAFISRERGRMPAPDFDRVLALLQRMGPTPPVADLRQADVLDAITRDKKVANGRLHFVLSAGIGTTEIADNVSEAELAGALRAIGVAT